MTPPHDQDAEHVHQTSRAKADLGTLVTLVLELVLIGILVGADSFLNPWLPPIEKPGAKLAHWLVSIIRFGAASVLTMDVARRVFEHSSATVRAGTEFIKVVVAAYRDVRKVIGW